MYVRDDKYLMFLKIFDNSIYVLVYIYVGICVYINISICIFVLDICRCSIDVVLLFCYEFYCIFNGNSG